MIADDTDLQRSGRRNAVAGHDRRSGTGRIEQTYALSQPEQRLRLSERIHVMLYNLNKIKGAADSIGPRHFYFIKFHIIY